MSTAFKVGDIVEAKQSKNTGTVNNTRIGSISVSWDGIGKHWDATFFGEELFKLIERPGPVEMCPLFSLEELTEYDRASQDL